MKVQWLDITPTETVKKASLSEIRIVASRNTSQPDKVFVSLREWKHYLTKSERDYGMKDPLAIPARPQDGIVFDIQYVDQVIVALQKVKKELEGAGNGNEEKDKCKEESILSKAKKIIKRAGR